MTKHLPKKLQEIYDTRVHSGLINYEIFKSIRVPNSVHTCSKDGAIAVSEYSVILVLDSKIETELHDPRWIALFLQSVILSPPKEACQACKWSNAANLEEVASLTTCKREVIAKAIDLNSTTGFVRM